MMRIPSERQLTRLFSIALAIWGLLLVISIPYQRLHVDEAWLGEQAYFFAQESVIRSELFHGFAHWDQTILLSHKLFIVLGGLIIRLFGWGLAQLRMVSLLSGVFVLIMVGRHLRRSPGDHPVLSSRIAPFALLAMPLFFKFTNYYRPEVILAAVGFASYVLLSRYLDHNRRVHLIGAALVAGVAVLIHLNGVIFIIAGVAVLALNRRVGAAGLFAVLAAVVAAFYFTDIVGQWDLFRLQLAAEPSLVPDDFRWDAPLRRLLDEHKRLFRKPEIIFTTSLFLGAFVYLWLRQPGRHRRLLAYTVVGIIGLGAIAQAKTTPYAIVLFPLFAVVIARATSHWLLNYHQTRKAISLVGIVLWAVFIIHSFAADALLAVTDKLDIVRLNRKTAAVIDLTAPVLAPMEFVFNEIENTRIRALTTAELNHSRFREQPLSLQQFITYANDNGINVILLDRERRDHAGLTDAVPGDRHGPFRVIAHFEKSGRVVLTRTEE